MFQGHLATHRPGLKEMVHMVMFMKEFNWMQRMAGWELGMPSKKKPGRKKHRLTIKICQIHNFMLVPGDGEKD